KQRFAFTIQNLEPDAAYCAGGQPNLDIGLNIIDIIRYIAGAIDDRVLVALEGHEANIGSQQAHRFRVVAGSFHSFKRAAIDAALGAFVIVNRNLVGFLTNAARRTAFEHSPVFKLAHQHEQAGQHQHRHKDTAALEQCRNAEEQQKQSQHDL